MDTDKREERLAYNREYNKANRDRLNAYRREHYAKNKHLYRNQMYKMRYGITIDDYNRMLEEQNNVCAICKKNTKKKELAVDHNHTTGEVRGLLCSQCNVMIGQIETEDYIIYNAMKYLRGKWDK